MKANRVLFLAAAAAFWAANIEAQESGVSLGYVRTQLERNGLNIAVDYAKKLQPNLELFEPGTQTLKSFSPDIKVLVGSDDAFNGVVAKYVGSFMVFDTTSVAGVGGIPDLGRLYHVFPLSAGIETDKSVSFANWILEAGYMPVITGDTRVPILFRSLVCGVFVQGGYRTSMGDSLAGYTNPENESDDYLARLKASLKYNPRKMFGDKKEYGVALVLGADLWYALLDGKLPYKVSGKLRFIVKKDQSFDVGYQKGSGEPNFQPGDQWTTNLTADF